MSFLKRVGIQLAEPFSERRLLNQGQFRTKWYPPYLLQNKLNGERCRAIKQGSRCLLLSSTESIIYSMPHISSTLLTLPDGEYDGELYKHGWDFSRIHSAVSTVNTINPDSQHIEFHIFDLVTEGSQVERLNELTKILPNSVGPLHRVPVGVANCLEGVMKFYDKAISDGYEGFIIRQIDSMYLRKRSQLMMKFKPKCEDTYKLIGVNQAISETGSPLGRVGSFMCEDDMGSDFKVSASSLTHQKSKEIWDMYLDGCLLEYSIQVQYQAKSDRTKAPHFVSKVELINPTLKNSTQQ